MGTQALWSCAQSSPNLYAAEQNGPGSVSPPAANAYHEVDFKGQGILGPHKRVPVGPDFQAELPQLMSGKRGGLSDTCKYNADSSMLFVNEAIWPQEAYDRVLHPHESTAVMCSCIMQNSMECVRLHIKQKRERLHDELGKAFYAWGFNEMGEAVADHWSVEEQLMFHRIVRRHPSSFWVRLFEAFPSRCMRELVSYYFNVFVLRRRALQNRYDPKNIDSDDDEMVLDDDEEDSASMYESDDEANESQVDDADNEESSMDRCGEEDVAMQEHAQDSCHNGGSKLNNEVVCAQAHLRASSLHLFNSAGTSDRSHDERAEAHREASEVLLSDQSKHCCTKHEEIKLDMMARIMGLVENATCKEGPMMQGHSLLESCERRVWESPTHLSSQADVDKLLSTKKMMEEFFGADDK